jgi:hypothetical protein
VYLQTANLATVEGVALCDFACVHVWHSLTCKGGLSRSLLTVIEA